MGLTLVHSLLQSCQSIYYANTTRNANRLTVAKSEFLYVKKERQIERDFIMLKPNEYGFPICLYKIDDGEYVASLLKCTHNGCELNVGGGIYSCPCHGSEFSKKGVVLEGPANRNLKTYKTDSDDENIYIYLL